jgi:hypothetical protein
VPDCEIDDVLVRLVRALHVGGILYMTVKFGEGQKINPDGRLFNFYTPQRLRETLERHHALEFIRTFQLRDTRPGFEDQQWTHATARRGA